MNVLLFSAGDFPMRYRSLCSAAAVLTLLGVGACRDATPPDVTPAVVTMSPATDRELTSGSTFAFAVTVTTKSGAVLSAPTVTWTTSDPSVATISAGGTVFGIHAGTARIHASAGTVSSSDVTVTVTPGAVASLVLRTAPDGAAAGIALRAQPVVELRDSVGNRATTATATVTATLSSGGGTLANASASSTNGVATFSGLTIGGTIGPRVLSFSTAGAPTVLAPALSLSAGTATQLAVKSLPSSAPGWSRLTTPVVVVRDAWENLTSAASPTVHAEIATGGAVLSGATFAVADSGVAQFSNVSILGPGGNQTLRFTAPGLASVTSTAVTISQTSFIAVTSNKGGISHTCGLSGAGMAYCWGSNSDGQLGDGTTTSHLTPFPVAGNVRFIAITAGGNFTCGLATTGDAYCWGYGGLGALGNRSFANRLVPTPVAGGLTFTSISAGYSTVCGLVADGRAYCWGNNLFGRLGDGTTTMRLEPTAVVGGLAFVKVTGGGSHTCGLTIDGSAYCWGENNHGQVGNGEIAAPLTETSSEVGVASPARVNAATPFTQLDAGLFSTCALDATGKAFCWGSSALGIIPAAGGMDAPLPVPVLPSRSFTEITTGEVGACALDATGAVPCWGYTPTGVPGLLQGLTFATIAYSRTHICAVTLVGELYCWGDNTDGQLGDGTTTTRTIPTLVVKP